MFEQLGEGIYRRRYESLDLNIGVVVGQDGLLIVDTRESHEQADSLRAELRRLSRLPVRWVVNTHWHWDHTFGNSRFADAEIWGHELCQIAMQSRSEDMKASAKRWLPSDAHDSIDEVEIMPPTKTFSEMVSLDIGRPVNLSYHGFAHTDSDTVIRVDDGHVAFFGDLVEQGAPPSFGDSYPVAWPLTLRLASDDMPAIIVPGHGDKVDESFVRSQHEELVAVAELATSLVNDETSLEEAARSGPYPVDVMKSALLRAQAVA